MALLGATLSSALFVIPQTNGFRLTLTTGVPVTTSGVTGATTVYWTPYKGNVVALNNGNGSGAGNWDYYSSAEVSLALGTLTSGLPYDVFAYNNSGTLTLELLAWTNGTTRATAIVLTDGVYLKSGALTRRYVGSFYTTSTTQTEDSEKNRLLYNESNQVARRASVADSTSHSYVTNAYRYWNNDSSSKIQIMLGNVYGPIQGFQRYQVVASTGTSLLMSNGFDVNASAGYNAQVTSGVGGVSSQYVNNAVKVPTIGYHYISVQENGAGAGSMTWQSHALEMILVI